MGIINSFIGVSEPISEIKEINPKLDTENKTNIPTIVVVVGESFTKLHSSLYGYEVNTNPLLGAMPDSLLHVFKNVHSGETHTVDAFASFMTTSPIADIPKSYECPNIVEIAKICGYNTLWISNQSKKGLYDNKVTLFAQLCDSAVFNGHEISLDKRDYDIGVVNHIKSSQKCHNTNRFLFVHLMGSHQKFNQRYPNSFAKFSSAEYSKYPKNQRDNLAAYDNTVLYNDYVMSEIIKCFSNDDAVLLYFSDHAIDVYKTDPNFCGHAMPGNKKSEQVSKLIPFMIYTSPKFRENHKDLTSMIEQSVDINFNTTDLPYMVMQLLGVTFSDRENKSPLIATY